MVMKTKINKFNLYLKNIILILVILFFIMNKIENKMENKNFYDNKIYVKRQSCQNCNKKGHEFHACPEPIISVGIILLKVPQFFSKENIKEDKEQYKNSILNIENIIETMKLNKLNFLKSDKLLIKPYKDRNMKKIFTDNKFVNKLLKKKSDLTVSDNNIMVHNEKDIMLFTYLQDSIEFLVIMRKHTVGFIEFIRGRYKTDNLDGIIYLFQQMTPEEIQNIGKLTFDELWFNLWNDSNNSSKIYELEYEKSKYKFEQLKNNETELGLDFYVNNVVPSWSEPEWGFPKGRRNNNEDNLECAKREFEEETGLTNEDYHIITEIEPLIEDFYGTNGKYYRHIYYVAIPKNDKIPSIDKLNPMQNNEIGAIGYYKYDDVIKLIRPYHVERKKIITVLYNYIINMYIGCSKMLENKNI